MCHAAGLLASIDEMDEPVVVRRLIALALRELMTEKGNGFTKIAPGQDARD